MFPRLLPRPASSFFLFGPRGTGKSSWVRAQLPHAVYLDLLESDLYTELLASPSRIDAKIPRNHTGWVVIDEVQRVPELLNEVHRLIEGRKLRFALTGSSARKLRRRGVNLLAGRARTLALHPLSSAELGDAFSLRHSLQYGQLPAAYVEDDPRAFLKGYVQTYLREEVLQEGLTRNLSAFSRFLEAASFSQSGVLNVAAVARDCHIERKVVEDYFSILDDLLLAVRLPVFARRAKRKLVTHKKFFFFDAGVYRAIRPRGPLDSVEEIEGPALETLVLQELRAINDSLSLGYDLSFWRTANALEIDFILYGERGLHAIEVKRSSRIRQDDLWALQAFQEDYPVAHAHLLYTGTKRYSESGIDIRPVAELLPQLREIL